MSGVDKNSQAVLKALLADLISEPIVGSIDEKVLPELAKVSARLATVSGDQVNQGRKMRDALDETDGRIRRLEALLSDVQVSVGDKASSSEAQEIRGLLLELRDRVETVSAMRNEIGEDMQGISSDLARLDERLEEFCRLHEEAMSRSQDAETATRVQEIQDNIRLMNRLLVIVLVVSLLCTVGLGWILTR